MIIKETVTPINNPEKYMILLAGALRNIEFMELINKIGKNKYSSAIVETNLPEFDLFSIRDVTIENYGFCRVVKFKRLI